MGIWLRKPLWGSVSLNFDHPLALGLTHAVLLNEYLGTEVFNWAYRRTYPALAGNIYLDRTNPDCPKFMRHTINLGNGSWTRNGIQFGSTSYIDVVDFSSAHWSEEGGMSAVGWVNTPVGSNGGTPLCMLCFSQNNPAMCIPNASQNHGFYKYYSGSWTDYPAWVGTMLAASSGWHQLGFSVTRDNLVRIYCDGRRVAQQQAGRRANTEGMNASDLWIGMNGDTTTYPALSEIGLVYAWRFRALTDNDFMSLYRNPYQFFRRTGEENPLLEATSPSLAPLSAFNIIAV